MRKPGKEFENPFLLAIHSSSQVFSDASSSLKEEPFVQLSNGKSIGFPASPGRSPRAWDFLSFSCQYERDGRIVMTEQKKKTTKNRVFIGHRLKELGLDGI